MAQLKISYTPLGNILDILWDSITSGSTDECKWSANNKGRRHSGLKTKISQRVLRTIWQLIKKRRAVNRLHGHWSFCCSADGLWWGRERWLSLSGLPSSTQQESKPIIEISGRGHRVDECVCVLYVWVHLKRVGGQSEKQETQKKMYKDPHKQDSRGKKKNKRQSERTYEAKQQTAEA